MAATADSMLAALNVQRATFTQELPVSIAARKDRLNRAIAMMVDHGAAFANAIYQQSSQLIGLLPKTGAAPTMPWHRRGQ